MLLCYNNISLLVITVIWWRFHIFYKQHDHGASLWERKKNKKLTHQITSLQLHICFVTHIRLLLIPWRNSFMLKFLFQFQASNILTLFACDFVTIRRTDVCVCVSMSSHQKTIKKMIIWSLLSHFKVIIFLTVTDLSVYALLQWLGDFTCMLDKSVQRQTGCC